MTTQWSEKVRQAVEAGQRRPAAPGDNITLKQLTRGSGFGLAVHCPVGQVTVIQDSQQMPKQTSFRDALLGKHQSPAMSVRAGIDELRRSEMYVVGVNDFVWEAKTVEDALRQAGAPEQQIGDLLRQAGLNEKAHATPKSLEPSELKRLSILQSLFAKARMVVYDKPFTGLDQTATQALSKLMVEAAMHQQRVMLVLGELEIPSPWKNHEGVKVAVPVKKVSKTGEPIPTPEDTPIEEMVRNLSSASSSQSKPSVSMGRAALQEPVQGDIITRPQMIFDFARGKQSEVVRSEVINNPNVPPELAAPAREPNSGKPPTNPGLRLTDVSWRRRLKFWAKESLTSLTAPPSEGREGASTTASRLALSILIGITVLLLLTGTISVISDLSMK